MFGLGATGSVLRTCDKRKPRHGFGVLNPWHPEAKGFVLDSGQNRLAGAFDQTFNFLKRWVDHRVPGQVIGHGILGLETIAGDAEDDLFIA